MIATLGIYNCTWWWRAVCLGWKGVSCTYIETVRAEWALATRSHSSEESAWRLAASRPSPSTPSRHWSVISIFRGKAPGDLAPCSPYRMCELGLSTAQYRRTTLQRDFCVKAVPDSKRREYWNQSHRLQMSLPSQILFASNGMPPCCEFNEESVEGMSEKHRMNFNYLIHNYRDCAFCRVECTILPEVMESSISAPSYSCSKPFLHSWRLSWRFHSRDTWL